MDKIYNNVREINCNIFDYGADVIIHQANCQKTMGTGIALALRKKWPEVYETDCLTEQNILGNISIATIKDKNTSVKYVINCYSQRYYGRDKRHTNYEFFVQCLEKVKHFCVEYKIKIIAAPYRMGCNNAGGDWRIIRPMFDVVFEDSPFDVLICNNEKI